MLGPAEIMRAEIIQDTATNDVDPALYVTAYPTRFNDISQVPWHFYKSLETIWGAPIADYVISDKGSGQSKSEGVIFIAETAILDTSEVRDSNVDLPGAESSQIDIIFQKARNITDPLIVKYAELRVRDIIDYTNRQMVRFVVPDLPLSTSAPPTLVKYDLSIDEDWYFKCFWRGATLDIATSHITARYRAEYVRLFLPRLP
jgi:hypothetical protein